MVHIKKKIFKKEVIPIEQTVDGVGDFSIFLK